MAIRNLSLDLLLFMSIDSYAQLLPNKVWIDGKVVNFKQQDTLYLKAANNDLQIELLPPYSTLSTTYFYRIPRLHSHWVESAYPVVRYHNLSGGNYTLEVYAKTAQSTTPIRYFIIDVQEAFWQKWWFWPLIVAYVILIIGIGIYLFFLYDFRQKLKLQYVRNQIASDLHDEVGSNLNSIAIFVELLRKKVGQENAALLPILDRITNNSAETVSLMRDTVWAINPANDSTEKLLEKMRSFGIEILSAKGVAFDFQSSIDAKKNELPMEQRRNLYLIYKEAINNIAKHAQATKANCTITQQQAAIHIMITDNGVGFDTLKTFEGNGLNNFKLRAQDNDLSVQIISQPQQGTAVSIMVLA